MKDKAILIGGGEFGRELLSWARAADSHEIIGYVDDAGPLMEGIRGVSLAFLGAIDAIDQFPGVTLLMAIGDPKVKRQVVERLDRRGARYGSVVHPSAVITETAQLGEGLTVGPHSYIATHAEIGRLVCINSLSGIGHDTVIGDYSTISSGCDITGLVRLGQAVFMGSGARIIPRLTVGDNARIGAGSVVVRAVGDGQTVYAPPARSM